jgi:hypothetical protein
MAERLRQSERVNHAQEESAWANGRTEPLTHFALKRHLLRASLYRKKLAQRFAAWHRFTQLAQNPSAL